MTTADHGPAVLRLTTPKEPAVAPRLPTSLLSALLVFVLLVPAVGLRAAAAFELTATSQCERDVEVTAGRSGCEPARTGDPERRSVGSTMSCAPLPRWRRIEEGGLPPTRAP
jgi:hypothetical protein